MLHARQGRLFVVHEAMFHVVVALFNLCPHYEFIVLVIEQDVFDYTMSQISST